MTWKWKSWNTHADVFAEHTRKRPHQDDPVLVGDDGGTAQDRERFVGVGRQRLQGREGSRKVRRIFGGTASLQVIAKRLNVPFDTDW